MYLGGCLERPYGHAEVEVGEGEDVSAVGGPHGAAHACHPLGDAAGPAVVAQAVHLHGEAERGGSGRRDQPELQACQEIVEGTILSYKFDRRLLTSRVPRLNMAQKNRSESAAHSIDWGPNSHNTSRTSLSDVFMYRGWSSRGFI